MKTLALLSTILLFTGGMASRCHGYCENPQPGGPAAPCPGSCPGSDATSNQQNACGGSNPFNAGTGNVARSITDLATFAEVDAGMLSFSRSTTSRYIGAIPTPFGAGGSWRHSFYWNIYAAGSDPATGNEIIHIDYPDGTEHDFNKTSATAPYLTSGAAVMDRIQQSATDSSRYDLYFPDGRHLAFYKVTSGADVSFTPLGIYTVNGQFYAFTNDAKGRVTRITSPSGRYLQLTYSSVGNFGVANVAFTYANASATSVSVAGDFNGWNTTANPMTKQNGVWTATVPIQLGSWQYKFVVNGSTWVNDASNPNTVPAGGPSTGNNSRLDVINGDNGLNQSAPTPVVFSYASPGATSVSVAGDFNGWNTNATPLTSSGGTWSATVNLPNGVHVYKFVVNGSQWVQDPSNPFTQPDGNGSVNSRLAVGYLDEAITQVSTSDGRSVSYLYAPFSVGGAIYSMLTQASYGDGTAAHYTYTAPFYGGRPLLKSADDPRYAGPASRVQYEYQASGVEGFVSAEKSLATGTKIAGVQPPADEANRTILNGNGGSQSLTFLPSGQIATRTDSLGRTRSFGYFVNGYGMLESETDPAGGVTTYGRTWDFGVINQITFPDNTTRTTTFADVTRPFFPAAVTDELGRVTTYTRDAAGQVTRVDYPGGSYETFAYNSLGQVLTHRLRSGGAESFTYDARGLKLTHVDALNNTTAYAYDANDRLSSVTDPAGHATAFQYNARGRVTKATYADNSFVTCGYDTYGNRTTVTNELGKTWTSAYDEYNRLVSVTDPLNRATQYSYGLGVSGCSSCHTDNKPTRITLPSGKATVIAYDTEWQKTGETVGAGSPDAATTQYAYDVAGNLVTLTDPRGKAWTYTYDSRHRRLSATDPLNHATTWTCDAAGNRLTETRPDGGVTTSVYDAASRLTQTTDPKGQITKFAYDDADNLLTLTDARSNVYSFTYDALNRKTRMTYPDGSHEDWSYGGTGTLSTYTTRAGQVKTCAYDSRDRLMQESWSGSSAPTVTRTCDAAGRLLTLNSSVSTLSYTYDNANQLLSETSQVAGDGAAKTVSYSYDADGNRASLTYPSGSVVTYGYTARSQLATITADAPPPIATYTYDLNGNRLTKALENGATALYAYDNANRLLSLDNQKAGVSFDRLDYAYNSVSNRTSRTQTAAGAAAATDAYGYDATDQLTTVSYGANGRSVAYAYDPVGNRQSVNDNGTATPYSANNLNQYTAIDSLPAPAYDANGNLTGYNGWTYAYDAQNRLTSVTGGPSSVTASFAYDARNRCVSRTIDGTATFYTYDGWNLIQERDSSDTELRRYIHGAQVDEIVAMIDSSGTHFYHQDALGSTVRITDSNGNTQESYSYDVYGAVTVKDAAGNVLPNGSAVGNRFLFTGREWLREVNLYDYRNRMYSQESGRFLQTDPIREDSAVNFYRYVENNPVIGIDPDGLTCKFVRFEHTKEPCGGVYTQSSKWTWMGGFALPGRWGPDLKEMVCGFQKRVTFQLQRMRTRHWYVYSCCENGVSHEERVMGMAGPCEHVALVAIPSSQTRFHCEVR